MTKENMEEGVNQKNVESTQMKEEKKIDEEDTKEAEKVNLTKVTTFEELLEVVGTRGKWNVLTFLMCILVAFTSPLQTLSYQFLGATPDHWCQVTPLLEANWTHQQILDLAIPFSNSTGKPENCYMRDYDYTAAAALGYQTTMKDPSAVLRNSSSLIQCSVREFNLSQYISTVVTEWDLVCERRVLYSTTQAVMQGGKLFGFVLFAYLVDALGRRPVVLVCSAISIIAGFLAAASPNIEFYIVLKFIIAAVDAGQYLGIFVFVMETCASKYRAGAGTLIVIPWAVGYMVVPGIAYVIRPWKLLQVAYTVPALYTIIYFWLLPESPRWLIDQGRYQEAFKVISWVAKVNRKPLPADQVVLAAMENIYHQVSEGGYLWRINEVQDAGVMGIGDIFLGSLKYSSEESLTNFLCSPSSTDPYLYIFLGGLLEVPSYLLLWPALIYIGRKKSLVALYLFCGLCIFSVMGLMLTYPGEAEVAKVFFSQIGKMAVTAAFQLAWMYTAELFPTKFRSLAVGQASFCARIGSTSSPYINDLLGPYTVWAPSALFGSVSLVSAALAVLLPETRHCDLPESNDFFTKTKEAGAEGREQGVADQDEGVLNPSFVSEAGETGSQIHPRKSDTH
nr:organic cation transporter protein-like [Cherax quadricarinatus]